MSVGRSFTAPTQAIADLRSGAACAILVEGEERASDAWILRQFINAHAGSAVAFYGRDGRENLLAEMPQFVNSLPRNQVAAIVDRDFTDEAEVTQCYAPDYLGHVFYWRRSCIENYLLEPACVAEVIETAYLQAPEKIPVSLQTPESIEQFFMTLAQQLAPQIAGNWVCADLKRESQQPNTRKEFRDMHQPLALEEVWQKLQNHYAGWAALEPQCFSGVALQERLTERYAIVQAKMTHWETMHEVVSAKHFLLRGLYEALPQSPRPPALDYLRNHLVRLAARQIPADIRVLVLDRILPRWQTTRAGKTP